MALLFAYEDRVQSHRRASRWHPHAHALHTLLVAAGKKNHKRVRAEFPTDAVDLGVYTMDVETGDLTLLYNDPEAPCFEARPLHPRRVPPVLEEWGVR